MQSLIQEDLHHVLSGLPADVRKLLQEKGLFLGGGFIRSIIAGEEVNDIDLFGPSKEMLELAGKSFALERKGARFFATDNAFTVLSRGRTTVQLIHRWVYDSAEKIIEDFDFSIAQAVIYWYPYTNTVEGGEWRSVISDHYYADLASRRLRYLAPKRAEDAGGSLLRMRKFLKRGYHIESLSMGKVIARLVSGVSGFEKFELPRFHDACGHEMSCEATLAQLLTSLLREVDPLRVVDGLELVDESQKSAVEVPLQSEQEPTDDGELP